MMIRQLLSHTHRSFCILKSCAHQNQGKAPATQTPPQTLSRTPAATFDSWFPDSGQQTNGQDEEMVDPDRADPSLWLGTLTAQSLIFLTLARV
jgi:hypothetical protein